MSEPDRSQALSVARQIGCFGAHQNTNGAWMPCASAEEFSAASKGKNDLLAYYGNLTKVVDTAVSKRSYLSDSNSSEMYESRQEALDAGKDSGLTGLRVVRRNGRLFFVPRKPKHRWQNLNEKPIAGIETLPGGGLVSASISGKSLGRPIGGVADFDGDGDNMVTGPDGVDNIPAPARMIELDQLNQEALRKHRNFIDYNGWDFAQKEWNRLYSIAKRKKKQSDSEMGSIGDVILAMTPEQLEAESRLRHRPYDENDWKENASRAFSKKHGVIWDVLEQLHSREPELGKVPKNAARKSEPLTVTEVVDAFKNGDKPIEKFTIPKEWFNSPADAERAKQMYPDMHMRYETLFGMRRYVPATGKLGKDAEGYDKLNDAQRAGVFVWRKYWMPSVASADSDAGAALSVWRSGFGESRSIAKALAGIDVEEIYKNNPKLNKTVGQIKRALDDAPPLGMKSYRTMRLTPDVGNSADVGSELKFAGAAVGLESVALAYDNDELAGAIKNAEKMLVEFPEDARGILFDDAGYKHLGKQWAKGGDVMPQEGIVAGTFRVSKIEQRTVRDPNNARKTVSRTVHILEQVKDQTASKNDSHSVDQEEKGFVNFVSRSTDPDTFSDPESARVRARNLGCIGIRRYTARDGKVVWLPCSNVSDYNRTLGIRGDNSSVNNPRKRGSRKSANGLFGSLAESVRTKSKADKAKEIDMSSQVVNTLAMKVRQHNAEMQRTDKKDWSMTNLRSLKSVYRRGLASFPRDKGAVSQQQWALGRVNAFLKILRTGKPENPSYRTDNDLLPKDHPWRKKSDAKSFSVNGIEYNSELSRSGYRLKYGSPVSTKRFYAQGIKNEE